MVIWLGQFWLMGRTVPTWRNRIEAELTNLDDFRRALNSVDRNALDRLINGVRTRRTAGGMLPAHDSWKPMLLAMLLECCSKIAELERVIETLIDEV
ncbi:MAG TPA: hypothetical protein D7I07_02160 [Candidatus Poseidoniales archaeon]|nr:MAG TPA: hypothetical protein D7I07_02160 [Candidatus Poseidoniales archaeon]|tara:strand:- start:654 stop:944 length:291 start_codon:yes stop_codon:yes gene_type:complete